MAISVITSLCNMYVTHVITTSFKECSIKLAVQTLFFSLQNATHYIVGGCKNGFQFHNSRMPLMCITYYSSNPLQFACNMKPALTVKLTAKDKLCSPNGHVHNQRFTYAFYTFRKIINGTAILIRNRTFCQVV